MNIIRKAILFLPKNSIPKTLIGLLIMMFGAGQVAAQQYSELWGRDGERWNPGAPLNDFSDKAGYRGGTVPLPRRQVRVSIKDFGGVGDGRADDTQALIDAIKACPDNGAVFIPNGKYKITDWIRIKNLENITILGEDMFDTQLIFPRGLEDIHPSPTTTTGNKPTTTYSWSGGFFWFDDAEEVGVENLSFIFPDSPWIEHFKIRGYNIMQISGRNNWVKNVRGYNADNGFFIRSSYSTYKNILLDAYPDRPIKSNSIVKGQRAGHHAMDIQGGDHNLVENYEETVKYIHSLGSENHATWNVWSNCKGPNIEIDHHSSGIANNLFTDIDMGKGLGSEGQRSINRNGQQETYWNLRSTQILPYDSSGAGIKQGIPTIPRSKKTIVVGWWLDWPNSEKNKRSTSFPWHEYIGNYDDIHPKNIYVAQLKKRLDIDNMRPELQITSPVTGSMATAKELTIKAVTHDRDGSIAKADLYLNGAFVATELHAPYEWTVPLSASNSYDVRIVATDNDGGTSTEEIRFTSSGTLTDNGETIVFTDYNTPGSCSIIPFIRLNDGQWASERTVTVEAGDKVEFGPQSEEFGASGGSWSWTGPNRFTASTRGITLPNVQTNQGGTYTANNVAQDGCESSLEFVMTFAGVNVAPTVSFAAPADGASYDVGSDVEVTANANDADGSVASVDLYLNGVLVREELLAPYNWNAPGQNDPNLKNLSAGSYTLKLVATDNGGASSEATASITVGSSNAAPSVSFVSPTNGTQLAAGDDLLVTVAANDSDGSISQVQLFLNGTALRTELLAPYNWNFPGQNDPSLQNLALGNYTLRVLATDDKGATSDASIEISVGSTATPSGTFVLKNVATGTVLDANLDGVIVLGSQANSDDKRWNFLPTSDGYVMLDNGVADRGPIRAATTPGNPIDWMAESANARTYINREWLPIQVSGNIYKFQSKDTARGFIAAAASGPITQADGDATTAHWELISSGGR